MRGVLYVFIFAAAVSCSPRAFQSVNRFDDPVVRTIAGLQDRRQADSLRAFLADQNPSYRIDAAKAFGSVRDTTSLSAICTLLVQDTSKSARQFLAFAVGQNASYEGERLMMQVVRQNPNPENTEAFGKTAKSFDPIQKIATVAPEQFHEGYAWMLYRHTLQAPLDSVPEFLPEDCLGPQRSVEERLSVSQFLARGVRHINSYKPELIRCIQEDPSPLVRMNAAFALRRIRDEDVRHLLQNVSAEDPDYRVRVNAIRSLQAFPPASIIDQLIRALSDSVANVSIAASEVIENVADTSTVVAIRSVIPEEKNWRAKSNLLAAWAKVQPTSEAGQHVREAISNSQTPYEKAAMIRALQYDSSASALLYGWMNINDNAPVVRSTAATSLVMLFRRVPRYAPLRNKIALLLVSVFGQGDPAVVGILSEAISDTSLHFRDYYRDATFLRDARSRLSLPRDVEAIQPLDNAIAILEGATAPTPPVNPFNHPIDWKLIATIRSDQKMTIETTRGNIVIRLFVDETPGTVANFIALSDKGYFNEKFIHRVVPNFVVQAGCNRGDGWGSEDYSIRSEFTPRKFTTGSVGMASAGKDTEGTQWFITHSPTPHLDGRYTNFAEVVSGMDVVHQLEVGDRIISVKRL
jgi:cyclophilin family peptidyl-prolyl cis-trans isomerase